MPMQIDLTDSLKYREQLHLLRRRLRRHRALPMLRHRAMYSRWTAQPSITQVGARLSVALGLLNRSPVRVQIFPNSL